MTEQASAGGHARPLGVMVTDGGVHPPEKWATTTAAELVAVDAELEARDKLRFDAAHRVRRGVRDVLVARFRAVSATSTGVELDQLRDRAMEDIARVFASTPWALHYSHPDVRTLFSLIIRRNLESAADIGRMTE